MGKAANREFPLNGKQIFTVNEASYILAKAISIKPEDENIRLEYILNICSLAYGGSILSHHRHSSSHKHSSYHKHRSSSGADIISDFAAGMLMGLVAVHAEKKHHYSERGKVNPYAVSAVMMGAGRMHTTEDILRTGAVMGALGVFDDDDSYGSRGGYSGTKSCRAGDTHRANYAHSTSHTNNTGYSHHMDRSRKSSINLNSREPEDDIIFSQSTADTKSDYDWRDYSTFGLDYGADPEDYDDVSDFEIALAEAIAEQEGDDLDEMLAEATAEESGGESSDEDSVWEDDSDETREWDPFNDDDFKVYIYCKVRLSDSGQARFYRTENESLREGTVVMVPSPDGSGAVKGEIISVKKYPRYSVPQDVEKTPMILE